MNSNPNQQIYAFIDAQNLYRGVKNSFDYWQKRGKKNHYDGWEIDMKRFFIFLKEKFKVSKAILFMGEDPKYQARREEFKKIGFDIVLKPYIKDNKGKTKGNCDAELVLHACKIEYPNYDKAVIITGDGDFFCLVEDLVKEGKLEYLMIPNEFRYSSLYKNVDQRFFVFISRYDGLLKKRQKFIPHKGG